MAASLKDIRERVSLLEAEGYTNVYDEHTNKGHFKIWFTFQGTEFYVVCGSSTSDYRGQKNMIRDAKKLVQGIFTQRTS